MRVVGIGREKRGLRLHMMMTILMTTTCSGASRVPRQYDTIHVAEGTCSLKEETGNDDCRIYLNVGTSPGSLSPHNPRLQHHGFVLDTMIRNSCSPGAADASVDIAGSVIAEAISPRHYHYRRR